MLYSMYRDATRQLTRGIERLSGLTNNVCPWLVRARRGGIGDSDIKSILHQPRTEYVRRQELLRRKCRPE